MVVVGCGCGVWVLDSVLVDVFVTGSCGAWLWLARVGCVPVWVGCGWFCGVGCFLGVVLGFLRFCVESLILAQDERWRRA